MLFAGLMALAGAAVVAPAVRLRVRDRAPGGGGGVGTSLGIRCLPLAVPIGLSPLLILTLCGSERVLVVSTEPGGGGG